MNQVVIIEPDLKHSETIKRILNKIDPELGVFHFSQVASFHQAFKSSFERMSVEIAGTAPTAGLSTLADPISVSQQFNHCELVLIVADATDTQSISPELWEKLMGLIKNSRKKMESSADLSGDLQSYPPKLILTTYANESGDIEATTLQFSLVFTFIVKPFDTLVLDQILRLALKPPGLLQIDNVFSREKVATIELIKDIDIEVLTELGFRTRNSHPIPIGKIARYYGKPFEGPNGHAVFAYCYSSRPHDDDLSQFACSFSYFGIPNEQLSAIRRSINKSKLKKPLPFPAGAVNFSPSVILILSKLESDQVNLTKIIEEKISTARVLSFASFAELIRALPIEGQISFLKNQKISTIGSAHEVKIVFDSTMSFIQAVFEKEASGWEPMTTVFGDRVEEIQSKINYFNDLLEGESRLIFNAICKSKTIKPQSILKVNLGDQLPVFIKLLNLEQNNDPQKGSNWALVAQELTIKEVYEITRKRMGQVTGIRAVFFDRSFSTVESIGSVKQMVKLLNGNQTTPAKFFYLSSTPVTKYAQLEELKEFDDVFTKPFDIFYLSRKLKMHDSNLNLKDPSDNSRLGIPLEHVIKTARSVTIKSISEVHSSLLYPRAIDPGEVRRFILWIPNSKMMPEILGVCRHSEPIDKDTFQCDFLFFGLRDHELKYVRQWLIENYVSEKMKEMGNV